jgi:hypothetical protein
MNEPHGPPEKQLDDGADSGWIESCNAANVVTVIVQGGVGNNTIRPVPPELLPYLRGFVPRPQKPPPQDGD